MRLFGHGHIIIAKAVKKFNKGKMKKIGKIIASQFPLSLPPPPSLSLLQFEVVSLALRDTFFKLPKHLTI
jgi:hypothetical protein